MIIDTVYMKLSRLDEPDINFILIARNLLNNIEIISDGDGTIIRVTGNYENLNILATRDYFLIRNSLCKYFHGNNYTNMSCRDIKAAIDSLSMKFNLPIHKANITRLDVAFDLHLKHPCSVYLKHIQLAKGYRQRMEQPHGIYIKSSNRELVIYDKNKELKDKRNLIPFQYKNKQVVRFELRLKRRVAQFFKRQSIIAENLYDEKFYISLKKIWQREFNRLQVSGKVLPKEFANDVRKFKDLLASKTLNEKGQNHWINEINCKYQMKEITKKQAQRLKEYIRKTLDMNIPGIDYSIRDELKLNILNIG